MARKLTKVLSFLLCFLLILEQSGFAQVAGQLDISSHILSLRNSLIQDKFRPLHLRSLSYDNLNNNFQLLLDKGDSKDLKSDTIEQTTKEILNYFFVGITLPNDSFWVNLRPDSPDNIIDPALGTTDVGKILLEADLQLKKDTAKFTSPETAEGKQYWDKLYKKAGEVLGSENSTIPTLTRPWIVPGEIIIRETESNAYIYKATLKVMLEEDYLKDSATYNFKDERLKQLNEYSSQLIRELIIPKLTKEVNNAKRYAPLRQVYYSLILAQWFKQKFYVRGGLYSWLIDKKNLNGLASKERWSKTTYFKEYQKSFKEGEYNLKEPIYTPYGQTIRSYFSGGIAFGGDGGPGILEGIRKGLILSKRNLLELPKNLKYITRLSVKGGTVNDPSNIEVADSEIKEEVPGSQSDTALGSGSIGSGQIKDKTPRGEITTPNLNSKADTEIETRTTGKVGVWASSVKNLDQLLWVCKYIAFSFLWHTRYSRKMKNIGALGTKEGKKILNEIKQYGPAAKVAASYLVSRLQQLTLWREKEDEAAAQLIEVISVTDPKVIPTDLLFRILEEGDSSSNLAEVLLVKRPESARELLLLKLSNKEAKLTQKEFLLITKLGVSAEQQQRFAFKYYMQMIDNFSGSRDQLPKRQDIEKMIDYFANCETDFVKIALPRLINKISYLSGYVRLFSLTLDLLNTMLKRVSSEEVSKIMSSLEEFLRNELDNALTYGLRWVFENESDEVYFKSIVAVLHTLGIYNKNFVRAQLRDTTLSLQERLQALVNLMKFEHFSRDNDREIINEFRALYEKQKGQKEEIERITESALAVMKINVKNEMQSNAAGARKGGMAGNIAELTPFIADFGNLNTVLDCQVLLTEYFGNNAEAVQKRARYVKDAFSNASVEKKADLSFIERVNLMTLYSIDSIALFQRDFSKIEQGWVSAGQRIIFDREISTYTAIGGAHLDRPTGVRVSYSRSMKREVLPILNLGGRGVVYHPFYEEDGYMRLEDSITITELQRLTEALLLSQANLGKTIILPKQMFLKGEIAGLSERISIGQLAKWFGLLSPDQSDSLITTFSDKTTNAHTSKDGLTLEVTVTNPLGIHAQTTLEMAETVRKHPHHIAYLVHSGKKVLVQNRGEVLGLNIEQGDHVTLESNSAELLRELSSVMSRSEKDTTLIYSLEDAPLDSEIVGQKGLNLIRMKRLGIPVPEAFFIRADRDFNPVAILDFYQFQSRMEPLDGKPRPVSVRSSPRISAPGLLDTLLNIGMSKEITAMGQKENSLQMYSDYLRDFGIRVLEISPKAFDDVIVEASSYVHRYGHDRKEEFYKELSRLYEVILKEELHKRGKSLPEGPGIFSMDFSEQLKIAVTAVKNSGKSEAVKKYLRLYGQPEELPVAVIVQQMVFGNLLPNSGAFVLSTADPVTSVKGIFMEFIKDSQGDAIVGGKVTPLPLERSGIPKESIPQINDIVKKLQLEFGEYLQVEGVIEAGKVYILQCRVLDAVENNSTVNPTTISQQESFKVISKGNSSECKGILVDLSSGASFPQVNEPVILGFSHADKRATERLIDALDAKINVVGIVTHEGGSQTHFATVVNHLNHRLNMDILYFSSVNISKLPKNSKINLNIDKGITILPNVALGAQVSHIKKLDNLLRILNVLRKSENVAEVSENSSDREIIEFCINELKAQGFIEETFDEFGNRIIKIKKGAEDNRLAQAIREWAIDKDVGVRAINFQGTDGAWIIIGFASELEDKNTLEHEQKEIAYRQHGLSWQDAHNKTVEDTGIGTKLDIAIATEYKAGQQDEIGTSSGMNTEEFQRLINEVINNDQLALGRLIEFLTSIQETDKINKERFNFIVENRLTEKQRIAIKNIQLFLDYYLELIKVVNFRLQVGRKDHLKNPDAAIAQYGMAIGDCKKIIDLAGDAFLEENRFLKNLVEELASTAKINIDDCLKRSKDPLVKFLTYFSNENLPFSTYKAGVPWHIFYNNPEKIPDEGWKLYITGTTENVEQIYRIVLPFLVEKGIAHKVANSLGEVKAHQTGAESGRIIVIYPENAEVAVNLAKILYEMLKDKEFTGPSISEAGRIKDSTIYYRYAEILKSYYINPDTGEEIPDNKQFKIKPPWIKEDPFEKAGLLNESSTNETPTSTVGAVIEWIEPLAEDQAEGGMITPDILKGWIKEGDIPKLVAHITRGLQGQDDNVINGEIKFIIGNLEESKRNEFIQALKEKGIIMPAEAVAKMTQLEQEKALAWFYHGQEAGGMSDDVRREAATAFEKLPEGKPTQVRRGIRFDSEEEREAYLRQLESDGYIPREGAESFSEDERTAEGASTSKAPVIIVWNGRTKPLRGVKNQLLQVLGIGGQNIDMSAEVEHIVTRSGTVEKIIKREDGKVEVYIRDTSLEKTQGVASLNKPGGIDFRALPIVTRQMQASLGTVPLNKQDIALTGTVPIANLDKEWQEIQNMLNAGMIPSSERIKEYLEDCSQKQDFSQGIDKILECIADILRLEEERVSQTEPALKELLVLLESDKTSSEMQLSLAKITILPGVPKRVNP